MELCLGTVQLGLKYGIASKNTPMEEESIQILKYALNEGITTFDTALAYGNSQKIIAKAGFNRSDINIITKIGAPTQDSKDVFAQTKECLAQLNTDYVDCLMFHNALCLNDDSAIGALCDIKAKGLAKSVGVSVYSPAEYLQARENSAMDIIQIPYNILDTRLNNLLTPNKELHARSAFLQGLLLMDKVPTNLKEAQKYIDKIKEVCKKNGISKTAYLLNYVKANPNIKKLVFGVDSLAQLKEIIRDFNTSTDKSLFLEFENIKEELLNPAMWDK